MHGAVARGIEGQQEAADVGTTGRQRLAEVVRLADALAVDRWADQVEALADLLQRQRRGHERATAGHAAGPHEIDRRSEERSVGQGWCRTWSSRWWPYNY